VSGELKASKPAPCCGVPPCSHDFCGRCLKPLCEGQTCRCPRFHSDMKCGSCNGPLEDDRTAVCHTCTPESVWFDMAAAQKKKA